MSFANKLPRSFFSFFYRVISIPLIVLSLSGFAGLSWAEGIGQKISVTKGLCKTNWLFQGQIGISTHFFPMKVKNKEEFVNKFQVQTVADQAAEVGASWFLLTLHQGPWIMMAPNSTYDRIIGNGDYTPERDVPLELQQKLQAKGIKLMLYVNIKVSPNTDSKVRDAMGGWPPNDKLIENIAAVYREYSLRYGDKVAGWWVDGAQNLAYRSATKREQWFKTIADALHSGNPAALVTFNTGLKVARYTKNADFTAGESEDINPSFPGGRWVDGAQWFLWTFLGGWWGSGGTRYSDQELGDYVSHVTSQGGALTFDVGTSGINKAGAAIKSQAVNTITTPHFGYIDPTQINQIKAIRKYLHPADSKLLSNCLN
jgi:hypothetical protein